MKNIRLTRKFKKELKTAFLIWKIAYFKYADDTMFEVLTEDLGETINEIYGYLHYSATLKGAINKYIGCKKESDSLEEIRAINLLDKLYREVGKLIKKDAIIECKERILEIKNTI